MNAHGGTGDLGREVLEAQRVFDVVLMNGERWSCQLVAWGEHELLVTTPAGKYLLPKHFIAYVVLQEEDDAYLAEAAETVATDSTSVATVITGEEGEIPPPVP
jgi:hypothetical protein